MGLDLVVEACAKSGHEKEWRQFIERSFADKELSDEEVSRFNALSVPGYERIGAPRVGADDAANVWILEAQEARTPEDIARTLREFDGCYVVRLVSCDGVPAYSNGGLYDGVDETSFRGSFHLSCGNVIDQTTQSAA